MKGDTGLDYSSHLILRLRVKGLKPTFQQFALEAPMELELLRLACVSATQGAVSSSCVFSFLLGGSGKLSKYAFKLYKLYDNPMLPLHAPFNSLPDPPKESPWGSNKNRPPPKLLAVSSESRNGRGVIGFYRYTHSS